MKKTLKVFHTQEIRVEVEETTILEEAARIIRSKAGVPFDAFIADDGKAYTWIEHRHGSDSREEISLDEDQMTGLRNAIYLQSLSYKLMKKQ